MAVAGKKFELLAPGGDEDAVKAAILAGADAVYCGLDRFNARNRAQNITLESLDGLIAFAHQHDCEVFITLNIMILESEIPAVLRLLEQLTQTDVDGVIVQDLGLAYLLKRYFPHIDVHASTQMNTHNMGQMALVSQLGASRVNLSRELRLDEIKALASYGRKCNLLTEVFVHGSYCIGFSGHCYASSFRNGASGNRGRCSQPCRDQFETTAAGANYPLNMKDNSAFDDMAALADAGVYSLKIEGRIKKPHYVYQVVGQWRQQIDRYETEQVPLADKSALYTVFNRDFSNGYLSGQVGKAMYIDDPQDFAPHYRAKLSSDKVTFKAVKQALYQDKTAIIQDMQKRLDEVVLKRSTPQSLKGRTLTTEVADLEGKLQTQSVSPAAIVVSSLSQLRGFEDETQCYYRLPDNLAKVGTQLDALFEHDRHIVPWFPAILIGDDYEAAVALLQKWQPERIVSDNSGLGYAASQLGIEWIAGPEMNIANSWALKCLKDEFGCVGAFVSSELSKKQMQRLVCPEGFTLHHRVYNPVTLMTSRQCLFQRSSGCRKHIMNKGCLPRCRKQTRITQRSGMQYIIDKQVASYNRLYAAQHHLNVQVIADLPRRFDELLVDLTQVETDTVLETTPYSLVENINALLRGDRADDLPRNTVNPQYVKGV
ncbi:peptidase U32 family protein [Thaumasiovibrio subtropicus]|uniref:peptidase U32 family protein n=1 Tax=Thaumasiovibrio subtropicus TaxID=1891207 RepID=UPI000B360367|nr:peptidase U32 family protein [Thaumasiovibrio subtropicus]